MAYRFATEQYLPGALPSTYYSALDREAYVPQPPSTTPPGIVPMQSMGMPTHPMRDQVDGLKQRIFQGVSRVELGFSGVGKGTMAGQQITPEMYGKTARQAMRELARLNKVELTTHASFSLPPLSGFHQRVFSDEVQARTVRELQRTIDFAADVARGGPIVVHLGEYQRNIADREGFQSHEKEEEKRPVRLVNKETGEIYEIPREHITWPEMEVDEHGHFKVDEHGNLIPKYDPQTKGFKLKELDEEDIRRLKEWYKKRFNQDLPDEKAYLLAYVEGQLRRESAVAQHVASDYDMLQQREKDLKALENLYREASTQWDDRQRLIYETEWKRLVAEKAGLALRAEDLARMSIDEIFDRAKRKLAYEEKYARDLATSHLEQEERLKRIIENATPIEDYAVEKTAEGLAQAAEYAWKKTRELEAQGALEKPLYIAPENIFPETYGSHPDELKKIITKAREAFVKRLTAQGVGKEEAERLAKQHIKGTFDIGHAYLWKKYWKKGDEKDFHEWLLKKAEELVKEGYVGHVHITDNMGYEDEHLSPGEGTIPIREFLQRIQKHVTSGDVDIIVEPAHQDFDALKAAWREYAGMIVNNLAADRWVNVEHSYFGRTSGPYFLFGDLAPNSVDYRVWSQTPYE